MTRQFNNLSVEVYSSGTTRINDPDNELNSADGVRYSTGYPGGLYLDASFRVARDVVKWWALNGAQRVVIRNGLAIVYEGYINDLARVLNEDDQYVTVTALGAWSRFLMSRRWRKRWADQRYDEDTWEFVVDEGFTYTNTTGTFSLNDAGGHDHNGQIRLNLEPASYGADDYIALEYTMPTGEVIRKVNYTYKLNGAAMRMGLYDGTNPFYEIADIDGASTSVIVTYTPATPVNSIQFQLLTQNSKTVSNTNGFWAYLQNLTVFGGEAAGNAITLSQIAKDIAARFTDLNSETRYIESNTKDLTPYVEDDYPTLADILTKAASYGDSNNDPWACGCLASDKATTPNGKPLLYVEAQPALTDYDYAILLGEQNVVAPFSIVSNWDDLYNYVIVQYQDENGKTQYLTPNDDATLKDTASIADYGQRDVLLSIGDATNELALSNGQRLLAARKDPQWQVTTPIRLMGYVRAKNGQHVPVSRLTAGNRLKIEDFITTLSGDGLTFLISHTTYDDSNETVTISIGPPDDLIYPYFSYPGEGPENPVGGGGTRRNKGNRWTTTAPSGPGGQQGGGGRPRPKGGGSGFMME